MSGKMDPFHYIPRRLDDRAKFFFWEMDVAMIGLIDMLVGIGSGFPMVGLFLSIGTVFFYGKLKAGKHPGMAIHLLYWFTRFPEPKELPSSRIRKLSG